MEVPEGQEKKSRNILACQKVKNKSEKIQGNFTLVKFLGVQWCGACQDIPSIHA